MSTAANILFTGRIFPGLRPFETEDALLFFGREEQTDELLRRLADTRFLAVVGLSGSGKSSLVRAGLLPALRRGHLADTGSSWRIAIMRPGADPLNALVRELNHTFGDRDDRGRMLRASSLGLVDASRLGRRPDENLLLVVDQFEELFRFQQSNPDRAAEAVDFVTRLLAAAQEYEPDYRVYIVITLRSEYLGVCAKFPGLPEALNESQYLVPRMTREQLKEAIQGPAALGGVKVTLDLVEELLDRTGDEPDQLPVLQHLLMRMWELRQPSSAGLRITSKEYRAVGGWDDALNQHANLITDSLSDFQQKLVKRIFQRLTEPGPDRRGVRRLASVGELAAVAQVPPAQIMTIVERFRGADCNFLTSPDRDLTEYSITDITHESLIRRWGRLNGWIEEEAKSGEWYRRIEDRLRLGAEFIVDPELEAALQARRLGGWNEAWSMRYATVPDDQKTGYHAVTRFLDLSAKRRTDEVHRLRRSRRFAAGIACVFAALAGAAAYFGHAAREATKVAEQERKAAQDARNQLVISQAEAEKARLEAEASQAAKRGEQARADRLQRSAEAAQKSLEEVKKAVASRQRDQDLEKVANRYYISPYSNDFSLWYAGTWYRSRSGVSTYDTRKVQR